MLIYARKMYKHDGYEKIFYKNFVNEKFTVKLVTDCMLAVNDLHTTTLSSSTLEHS